MNTFLIIFYLTATGGSGAWFHGPFVSMAVCQQEEQRVLRNNLLNKFAAKVGTSCIQPRDLHNLQTQQERENPHEASS